MTWRGPSRPLTSRLVGLAAALALVATGCGGGRSDLNAAGDIPDTQAFVVFTPAAGRYQIEAPEGWARTDSPDGVAFDDKLNPHPVLRLRAARCLLSNRTPVPATDVVSPPELATTGA